MHEQGTKRHRRSLWGVGGFSRCLQYRLGAAARHRAMEGDGRATLGGEVVKTIPLTTEGIVDVRQLLSGL